MVKNNIKSKKGFTIIEVVLVLAIAGLIFLMVFIALPALQTSQRNTQRRDDLARFSAQLNQYEANNRGTIPTNWDDFLLQYLADVKTQCSGQNIQQCLKETAQSGANKFVDPDGDPYTVVYVGSLNDSGTDAEMASKNEFNHKIYVYSYAQCNGEHVIKASGARNVAISFRLESAGIFCGTN